MRYFLPGAKMRMVKLKMARRMGHEIVEAIPYEKSGGITGRQDLLRRKKKSLNSLAKKTFYLFYTKGICVKL